jgi:hypothetical protein
VVPEDSMSGVEVRGKGDASPASTNGERTIVIITKEINEST